MDYGIGERQLLIIYINIYGVIMNYHLLKTYMSHKRFHVHFLTKVDYI